MRSGLDYRGGRRYHSRLHIGGLVLLLRDPAEPRRRNSDRGSRPLAELVSAESISERRADLPRVDPRWNPCSPIRRSSAGAREDSRGRMTSPIFSSCGRMEQRSLSLRRGTISGRGRVSALAHGFSGDHERSRGHPAATKLFEASPGVFLKAGYAPIPPGSRKASAVVAVEASPAFLERLIRLRFDSVRRDGSMYPRGYRVSPSSSSDRRAPSSGRRSP